MEIAEETNRFSPNPPLFSPSSPYFPGRLGRLAIPEVRARRGCERTGGGRWLGLGSFQSPPVSRRPFTCLGDRAAAPGAGSCQLPEVSGKLLWRLRNLPSPKHGRDGSKHGAGALRTPPGYLRALHQSALGPEKHSPGCPHAGVQSPPLHPPRSPCPFLCTPEEFCLPCLTEGWLPSSSAL